MRYTRQEMLDKVYDYYINKKRRPGWDPGLGCRYRGERGTKCAIGIFLPNNKKELLACRNQVADMKQDFPEDFEEIFGRTDANDLFFLDELQRSHDLAAHNSKAFDGTIDLPTFYENLKKNLTKLFFLIDPNKP